jgi:hypothetical protein
MNLDVLVFDVGDQITGWGRLMADDDGQWLDLASAIPLPLFDPPRPLPRSHNSVRLIGADLDAVPIEFGPDRVIAGRATVTGIWLGDAIEVRSQSPTFPPPSAMPNWTDPVPDWTNPPCPAPSGGWPRGEMDANLDFDRDGLGNIAVSVVTFRPSRDQAVLVVAATDVDAATAVLKPQLHNSFCVLPSRWTREELDAVQAHLDAHHDDWHLDTWGPAVDSGGQPYIEADLVRVTAEIATWAARLPDGLLKLVPALVPASLLQSIN